MFFETCNTPTPLAYWGNFPAVNYVCILKYIERDWNDEKLVSVHNLIHFRSL